MFTRSDGINDLNNIFEEFIKIYKVVPSNIKATNHKYLNLNVPLTIIYIILLLIQIPMVTKLILK